MWKWAVPVGSGLNERLGRRRDYARLRVCRRIGSGKEDRYVGSELNEGLGQITALW